MLCCLPVAHFSIFQIFPGIGPRMTRHLEVALRTAATALPNLVRTAWRQECCDAVMCSNYTCTTDYDGDGEGEKPKLRSFRLLSFSSVILVILGLSSDPKRCTDQAQCMLRRRHRVVGVVTDGLESLGCFMKQTYANIKPNLPLKTWKRWKKHPESRHHQLFQALQDTNSFRWQGSTDEDCCTPLLCKDYKTKADLARLQLQISDWLHSIGLFCHQNRLNDWILSYSNVI